MSPGAVTRGHQHASCEGHSGPDGPIRDIRAPWLTVCDTADRLRSFHPGGKARGPGSQAGLRASGGVPHGARWWG